MLTTWTHVESSFLSVLHLTGEVQKNDDDSQSVVISIMIKRDAQ